MAEGQLDFFSDIAVRVDRDPLGGVSHVPISSEIDDERLIAAIPESDLADSCIVAAEAGWRRLAAAVPALAALCRRFAGFGARRIVPEQAAAIEALAMIGGRDAALAVSQLIERAIVQEPTLPIAVSAAARLGSALSPEALRHLLRHAEPGVRADACRCARPLPDLILILIDLLDDLDRRVATSAATALGRMGRIEARPVLKSLLRDDPSEEVIDAVSSIADEECAVLLGRIARSKSALADAAFVSLENIDDPRAASIAGAITTPQPDARSRCAGEGAAW
ncbi:MAG TPA: HEAT repeat domain-containing protein [Xanthobacteraceae bacterium]|nr:HEAT repeat domain-containing protein [Xanthobacteraceae bacterium]